MPSALWIASTYRTRHTIPRGRSCHDGGGDGPTKNDNPGDVCFYFCFTSPTTTVKEQTVPSSHQPTEDDGTTAPAGWDSEKAQACRQNTNSTPYGIRWKRLKTFFGVGRQLRACTEASTLTTAAATTSTYSVLAWASTAPHTRCRFEIASPVEVSLIVPVG